MATVCRTWRSRWSQVQDLSGLPCWGGHELCWQYRSRLLFMLLVLMCSWCWSWFLPGWRGHKLCWQYRSRIFRSFKMLILIIDYCLMRLWTVLTIQVRVIVHDADADVFINNDNNDIMLILDRNSLTLKTLQKFANTVQVPLWLLVTILQYLNVRVQVFQFVRNN